MSYIIDAVYFLTAAIFIIGLKQMSSPVTAHRGIVWAGIAMVVASLATFGAPEISLEVSSINLQLMLVAIVAGSTVAYISAKRVAMTDMPQMIAMYNGMGGGAAAAIAAVELVKLSAGAESHGLTIQILAVLGAVIGAISFSGSAVAFAKLQGIMKKTLRLPLHQVHGNDPKSCIGCHRASGEFRACHDLFRPGAYPGCDGYPADRRCRHASGDLIVQCLNRSCGSL